MKNGRIKTDRCHRSLGQLRTEPTTRPRIAYIRLHNYADKQMIMQNARNMGEITVSGNRIHFIEDFSHTVDKKRREFLEAKKSFRAQGIPYRMLFPAALRIAHDNKVHLFKTPAEAQRYVEEMQKANT